MRQLLPALRAVERDLSSRLGGFELFGVFRLRRTARWTLVVAAPWVDPGLLPTLQLLDAELKRVAGLPARMLIPRIMLVPDAGFVEAVHDVVDVEHGLKAVGPGDYGNVEVVRGYVITSRRPADVPAATATA